MRNDESERGEMRIVSSGEGRMDGVVRFVWTTVILIVIVLVTVAVLARTAGGRSLIEDQIGKKLGAEVSVARSRIGLPYSLVLEDVVSKDFADGQGPGFRVAEARLGVWPMGRLNVRLREAEVVLVRGEGDTWLPECLSPLGDLPVQRIEDGSRATGLIRERMALHLQDGAFTWRDAEGHTMAAAEGVSFDMVPAGIPGRRMFHCRARIDQVLQPDLKRRTKVRREWLAGDGIEYIEIERGEGSEATAWKADAPAAE